MSEKCFNCGQDMPTVFVDPFNQAQLRLALSRSNVIWEDLEVGESFAIDGVPPEVEVKVIATDSETDWDSYGDAVGTGYVVFEVSDDAGNSKNYKVDGSQSSYSGWEYDEEYALAVSGKPKTVTVWEEM